MDNLIIFLIILGAAGLIALVAFIIHRLMHPKLKEDKKDEQEIVKEELDRVLVPIEDEKTAEEISNYKDKEDDK
ncbi:MAG: hypothetical protein GXY57_04810 [Erysipelotrichaceae bacterium]|jgi:uncharacterized iron-regulated membrane protein|nr:hypothetical protein [Bacilli bacterium]NLV29451.1 hypothetical protein [Erysipelotrichaceae bacterium]HPY79484.1 hypothetical protein [Bacilli bacterium]HQA55552.1 hypothetical protein [Bacilli bacterium]